MEEALQIDSIGFRGLFYPFFEAYGAPIAAGQLVLGKHGWCMRMCMPGLINGHVRRELDIGPPDAIAKPPERFLETVWNPGVELGHEIPVIRCG